MGENFGYGDEEDDEEYGMNDSPGKKDKQSEGGQKTKDEKKKAKKKDIYLDNAKDRSRNEYSGMIKLDKKNQTVGKLLDQTNLKLSLSVDHLAEALKK